MDKQAASQVSWALLTEGVTGTRVLVHQMRHYLNRAQSILRKLDKEQVDQQAGDLTQQIPQLQTRIERELDRLGYAVSLLGQEYLRNRISLDDRKEVDAAVEAADEKQYLHRESFQKYRRQYGMDALDSKNYYRQNRNKIRMRARVRYRKQRNQPLYKRYRKEYRRNPLRFRKRAGEEMTFWWAPRDLEGRLEKILEDRLLVRFEDGTLGTCRIDTFLDYAWYDSEEQLEADLDLVDEVWG